MIKSDVPGIMSGFFSRMYNRKFKFIYKGKEYFPLFCRSMKEIGVITLVNGGIHQSINFKRGLTIFFNKAKRLALYGGDGEYHKKLMDINYGDVIAMVYKSEDKGDIVNLMTGETVTDNRGYKYLEFREE